MPQKDKIYGGIKIKFVYFDVGNVLLAFENGLRKIADKFNRDEYSVRKVFDKYDDSICKGRMLPEELWSRYKEELSIKDTDLDFKDFWVSGFEVIRESLDLARQIKSAGLRIGILSNMYPRIIDLIENRNTFSGLEWDSKVISSIEGYAKPEREIYEIAQDKAGSRPEEILFIDDNKINLVPARSLGWQTFLFNRNEPRKSVEAIRKILLF